MYHDTIDLASVSSVVSFLGTFISPCDSAPDAAARSEPVLDGAVMLTCGGAANVAGSLDIGGSIASWNVSSTVGELRLCEGRVSSEARMWPESAEAGLLLEIPLIC